MAHSKDNISIHLNKVLNQAFNNKATHNKVINNKDTSNKDSNNRVSHSNNKASNPNKASSKDIHNSSRGTDKRRVTAEVEKKFILIDLMVYF